MKKILLLSLIFSAALFVSCTQKKDRLTADTLVISMEPPQLIVGKQTATIIKAVAHNASGVTNADINPSWSIVTTGLGSFSPAQGKTVTFNSGTLLGSTTIYAQYGTAQAIGNITVSDVTQNTVTPALEFDVYRDVSMLSNAGKLLSGTPNPPTALGGRLYKFAVPSSQVNTVGLTTVNGILGDDHSEGSQGLRVDIGNYPGGIWFQFGDDATDNPPSPVVTDLSAYSSARLVFDVKTTKDLKFEVHYYNKLLNGADVVSNYGANMLDGNWHTVSVPIKSLSVGINFSQITYPFEIHSISNTNFSFYVDNVRWEQ